MRTVRFQDSAGRARRGELHEAEIRVGGRTFDPDEVEFLPPVEASKVIAVGPNHVSNVEGNDREAPRSPADLKLFVKPPNALVGHGGTATLPARGEPIHELELGVVIGRECRDVAREDAEDVIAGYTCVNEITDDDPPESFDATNAVRMKAIDDSAPAGPAVVSPDLVPDDADMELRVNGTTRQRASRTDLLFDEAALIEEISSYMTLEPGDLIATGAPVGQEPLADGDRVEVEIAGIGTLRHDVRMG